MSPIRLRLYIIATSRRKISQRLLGQESMREKNGVASYEDLLTINFSGICKRCKLPKSDDLINEVLDDAASAMSLAGKERQ
ncbi:hypothetical protein TNCV_4351941 [Trichonephila clavipes]|nr:hypothetical protein TNCV_4351941 [Trichonephila clavipes]